MHEEIASAPPSSSNGPREAFFYLLDFLTLYVSVIGMAVLSWGVIDELLDDRLYPAYGALETIRVGIAMVVVGFPSFVYLKIKISRMLASGQMDGRSLLRKILTYLTLFVIAITAVIDLIIVIYSFLGGELSARTFSKAAIIFVLVGLVFAYHLLDLKETKTS